MAHGHEKRAARGGGDRLDLVVAAGGMADDPDPDVGTDLRDVCFHRCGAGAGAEFCPGEQFLRDPGGARQGVRQGEVCRTVRLWVLRVSAM